VKLRRLVVAHWRGLAHADIAFGDGVTLITGPNEAGKSSLIEALRCLFRYPADSGHRDIKAVWPVHVDEAPEVTLEAELGATRMVFAKRFRKPGRNGKTTLRLSTPGRNDRILTGREAHDQALQLLREHIDTDLWEALQIEQGKGVAQAALKDRRGLQQALDHAAGNDAAPTSDAPTPDAPAIDVQTSDSRTGDGLALFARVEEEYRRYFAANGRPRDRLAGLPREIDALVAERDGLRRRIDAIEDVVDRHHTLLVQRDDVRRRLPELRDAAARAEAHWRDVQQRKSAWEQAGLEARNRALDLDAAARQQRERDTWAGELARLADRVGQRRQQAEAVDGALAREQSRLALLESEQAGLEEAAAQALTRQRRSEALLDGQQARREIARLDRTLDKVADLDRQRASALAVVDTNPVDDAALGGLRRLHQALIEAEAAARAASPRVAFKALRELDIEVGGRPQHLRAGERHVVDVTAGLALTLPDVAEITVAATEEIATRAARAAQARRAIEVALGGWRLASLADAEASLGARHEALAALQRIEAQRADWLGEDTLPGLRERRDRLVARVEAIGERAEGDRDPADFADADELAVRLEDARAQEREARDALQALAARLIAAREGIAEQRVRQAALVEQIDADGQRAGQLQQQQEAARRDLSDADLAGRVDALRRESVDAEQAEARLRGVYDASNPEQAELLATNTAAARDRQVAELNRLQVAIGELDGQLLHARREGVYERLAAVEVGVEQLQEELARIERRAAAARRLFEVMSEARDAAARRYVQPLKRKIDALGRLVFASDFAVDVGDDLAIVSRSLDGVTVPFDSLSVGAQEQLGILARLAAAQLVALVGDARDGKGGDTGGDVPLLMDDTLGYADQARLSTMGAAIARVARDNQVIILTCMPGRFAYVGDATTVDL
jgi:hypothetical protein